jgi:hypothetical protein
MPRLIRLDTILEDWHPLANTPAPEYVPTRWDGPQVGKGLTEAFRILSRLPMNGHPRAFGTAWPECAREWSDELAILTSEISDLEATARAQNRVRIMPSASEISRMEAAIGWPTRYLTTRPILSRTVQLVALWRSRERELNWIARKMRLGVHTVRARNRTGLDLIAAGLHRDGVPVL